MKMIVRVLPLSNGHLAIIDENGDIVCSADRAVFIEPPEPVVIESPKLSVGDLKSIMSEPTSLIPLGSHDEQIDKKLQSMFTEIQAYYLSITNCTFVNQGGIMVGVVTRDDVRKLYGKMIEVFRRHMHSELSLMGGE